MRRSIGLTWERFHRERRGANHPSRWNRSHNPADAGLETEPSQ